MIRYDLLVIDLDGTLLASDGSISLRNHQALAAARDAGLEIIIATGRALSESRAAITAIGHQSLLIAAGGSLLCDCATGCTLDRRVLPHDVVVEATRWLLEHDHRALILKDAHATGYDYLTIGECALDPASEWWFAQMNVAVRSAAGLHEDEHPHDTVRAGAVACGDRLAPLARWLRDELGGRCSLQHWPAVTATHAIGSPTHLLEIFQPNVSKWTMVEALCARRGVDPGRVAALGDGLNDMELVRHAGLGVAMANSIPELHAAASRVTAHHDEDGVAIAIEHILSGAW